MTSGRSGKSKGKAKSGPVLTDYERPEIDLTDASAVAKRLRNVNKKLRQIGYGFGCRCHTQPPRRHFLTRTCLRNTPNPPPWPFCPPPPPSHARSNLKEQEGAGVILTEAQLNKVSHEDAFLDEKADLEAVVADLEG